jgi:AcrR family transcriptional regulator
MPLDAEHVSLVKGPIDDRVAGFGHEATAGGVSGEPNPYLTVPGFHIERSEQHSADHLIVKPNRVAPTLIGRLPIGEPLQERSRFVFGVDVGTPRKPFAEMVPFTFDEGQKFRRRCGSSGRRSARSSRTEENKAFLSLDISGTLHLLCTSRRQQAEPPLPALGDHDARRADVSEAVWRVLARCGVGGLTIRSVATEIGATTGLVSHYFPSKRALIAHARTVAELRTAELYRRENDTPSIPSLRASILAVLPLNPEMVAMSKAWVSFWDAAIGDEDLGASETRRYEKWRTRLAEVIVDAQLHGTVTNEISSEDLSVIVGSFAHGLVVQSLFDPKRFPPTHQTELVDQFLRQLGNRADS